MIRTPRPSHAAGIDMVRNDIFIVRKRPFAEGARTALGDDLPFHQLAHFGIGADLPDIREGVGDRQYDGRPFDALVFPSEWLPGRSKPESGELGTVDFDGISWFPPVWIWGELTLIYVDECLSAEEEQSDGVFMRALPQSVPVMLSTEVAHPGRFPPAPRRPF